MAMSRTSVPDKPATPSPSNGFKNASRTSSLLRSYEPADAPQSAHYAITPYAFRPRVARKLVSSYYIDMGQGLLDVLAEIHDEEGSLGPARGAEQGVLVQ